MKHIFTLFLSSLLILFLKPNSTHAQNITSRVVKDNLFIPWEIIWGPDNYIWLTQKSGYICRLEPETGSMDTLYHETATVIQGEGGMLGLALHPQFATSPYVYAAYNYNNGSDYRARVVRYRYNGSNALDSATILMDVVDASSIHNGSRLLIVGDKLYITTGDASQTSTAQNNASPNGKIHRINLDGSIPADNPFPGSSIWTKGHRNPQGLVFANGILYSSEHGPNNDDELNIIKVGQNYGWPNVEGFCNTTAEMQFCADSSVVEPLYAWTPTLAVCGLDYFQPAPGGGPGPEPPAGSPFPTLQGNLLMCTLKNEQLYLLKLNEDKDSIVAVSALPNVNFGRLRDLCISPDGRIFLSTSNSASSGTGSKIDQIIELKDADATGLSSQASRVQSFYLYPNPASATITVSPGPGAAATYQVISPLGQTLMAGHAATGPFQIPVAHLPAGTYVLVLSTVEGSVEAQRFLISR